MTDKLVFFVPYHTGYAHTQLIHSFACFSHVHLFIYKWNPAQQYIRDYFSNTNQIEIHEFSIDTILREFDKQQEQQHQVVVLLTASRNYSFGQIQFRYFACLQKSVPSLIDVYSTGHCMYGCQSCTHAHSHRLPITFTNYMRTKHSLSNDVRDEKSEIIICPSFSSKEEPFSLLSNRKIVETIVAFSFPHTIKLHPLTYPSKDGDNPLFCLSELEQENVAHFLTSKNLLSEKETNTLEFIEHARVIICDFDSSIPFEALYFQDEKHILVYETAEQHQHKDDRRIYFHTFQNAQQLTYLLDRYFTGELECKTKRSHQFFLEKYEEPDGNEIERLANIRHWMEDSHHYIRDQKNDVNQIKQEIHDEFILPLTQTTLYALGEHTIAQVDELGFGQMHEEFSTLFDNIAEL